MTDPSPTPAARLRTWLPLVVVFAVALGTRSGFSWWRYPDPTTESLHFADEQGYWDLALSLRQGNGLVGEFGHRAGRLPLYPAMLAWWADEPTGVGSARHAQWWLGALAAPFAFLLGRQLAGGVAGWVGGLATAVDPALTGGTALLLTETLSVTALIALWWMAWPLADRDDGHGWRWGGVALLAALNVYVRESALVMVAGLLVILLIRRARRRTVVGVVGVVGTVVAVLLPWAWRNQQVTGSWVWLTTRGGISLYDGVRPGATGASDLADVKQSAAVAGLDEIAWDRHFRDASRAALRDEPGRVIGLVPVKLARTWSPVLNAAEYQSSWIRLVFAGWYVPMYVLVAVGVVVAGRQGRWAVVVALLMPALCVSAVHAVFVGSVRYRLPALPMLFVLAGLGIGWWVDRWRRPEPEGIIQS